jgi:hypothetical protein
MAGVFLNLSVNQNYLKGLLKYRLLGKNFWCVLLLCLCFCSVAWAGA